MSFGLVSGSTDLLFSSVDWHRLEEAQRSALAREVDGYHPEKLLNTADDGLIDYFFEKYRLDVPELQIDQITVDQKEIQIDVSGDRNRYIRDRGRPFHIKGTEIEVAIPFTGDAEFFRVQPPTFSLSPPRGEVKGNALLLRIRGDNLDGPAVRQQIDRTIAEIGTNLDRLGSAARAFNAGLAAAAESLSAARKEKLLKDRNLVANLGFAIKPRAGAEATYASPAVRRKITAVQQPVASTAAYKPEPALSDAQYRNILEIMENMIRVMELSPSAFANSDEESIRMHFLVQLNGHYQGQATGETFNYEGKTDILIKDKGRNIFIAECKFWRGERAYCETIDQLLGYLSWRDTKGAIIIFNRNKLFSEVLAKMKAATEAHPNCQRLVRQLSETSWEFRFTHRDDPGREMTLTVMAFDVPRPE